MKKGKNIVEFKFDKKLQDFILENTNEFIEKDIENKQHPINNKALTLFKQDHNLFFKKKDFRIAKSVPSIKMIFVVTILFILIVLLGEIILLFVCYD